MPQGSPNDKRAHLRKALSLIGSVGSLVLETALVRPRIATGSNRHHCGLSSAAVSTAAKADYAKSSIM